MKESTSIIRSIIGSAVLTLTVAGADASLVGDQIFIDRLIPDASGGPFSYCQDVLGTGPHGCAVTVADGTSDRLSLSGGNNLYVNVEASEIRIEYGPEFGGGGPFDEHLLVFNDLDFVAPAAIIGGFTLDTNFAGMDESRIRFTADSVSVNHANLLYDGGQYLVVHLHTVAIPEPTAGFLAVVAASAMPFRRRRPLLEFGTRRSYLGGL